MGSENIEFDDFRDPYKCAQIFKKKLVLFSIRGHKRLAFRLNFIWSFDKVA